MALLTCTWSLGFQYRWRRGAEAANSLLLITTLSLGEKLIKVGNHHSKDYLCHRSWNNNRHKSSEVKTETSFGFYLSEKGTSSGLCFPPGFFWAAGVLVLLVGGDSLGWGRFGVRARVKGKCVIVTELMRESRGGQCVDRTLGLHDSQERSEHEPPRPPRTPGPPTSPPLLL